MKFFFLSLLFLITFQITALDFSMSTGVFLDYRGESDSYHQSQNPNLKLGFDQSSLGIGAFVDLYYAVLYLKYYFALNASLSKYDKTLGVSDLQIPYYSKDNLDFSLFFKYPFKMGDSFNIAPEIGFAFDYMTVFKEFINDKWQQSLKPSFSPFDFSFFLGLSMDLKIVKIFYISPKILFGINVLPDRYLSEGKHTFGIDFLATFGIDFKFEFFKL